MSTRNLIKSFESGRPISRDQKNVLIVYAHPEPKSFNGALLRTAVQTLEEEGHKVEVSDLYAMHFEPRTQRTDMKGGPEDGNHFKYQMEAMKAYKSDRVADDIKAELDKVVRADLLIFQFPLAWFSFPAILKGWFDRIYIMGFAYGMGKLYSKGMMSGKKAMLSFTTGAPQNAYLPTGMNGDINMVLWPMQSGVLRFAGFDVLAPRISYGVAHVSDEQRKHWLDDWVKRLRNIFNEEPLKFVDFDHFDETMKLKDDYLKTVSDSMEGLSVGHNLGKVPPKDSMLNP